MTEPVHIAAAPTSINQDGGDLERLPIACLILDATGRICQSNAAASRLLGWRPDWLRDQQLHRWLIDEHTERFDEHLRLTFSRPERASREDLRIKTRDGRLEDVCLQSIVDERDSRRCRTVAMEITDRARAERQSRLLQRELAHISRVNSMGEFAGSLAHELNQPLGAVVLYCRTALKLARADGGDRERLLNTLERAIESAENASETLRHLNRFLRKNTGEREVVNLDDLVSETVRIMEASAEDQDCSVQVELCGLSACASVDKVQIEQVLINLMHNGIEAMVGAGELPRRLIVSTHACPDAQVEICVRDNGPGLSAAMQERIFEPFFTTKPGGLGLGLSISQTIVEAHSGRLWVESTGLAGTAFHLRIPGTVAA